MRRAAPVLIAGGGIGGLATALTLARRGIASCVLERRPAFSEAGAGIQLGPNGTRVLLRIGAARVLAPHAYRPRAIAVRAGNTARVLAELPLGDWIEARHGAPYWVAHRRDLQAALLAEVGAEPLVELRTAFDASHFVDTGDRVILHDAQGNTAEGTALVIADGQHSQLRRQLVGGPGLRFSGKIAARAVLEAGALAGALDAESIGVWLAPEAHVVHYPVRAGREIAVVVIIAQPWEDADWAAPADAGTIMARLQQFSPALRQALHKVGDWRRWSLYDADPLPAWTRGRVTLLGDAAHPVLPFLAQGGSMALEDAVTLAACLAASDDGVESALLAYQRQRMVRTARVVRVSRRNGRIFHLAGMMASARNAILRSVPGNRIMVGYDWLYGWERETQEHAESS